MKPLRIAQLVEREIVGTRASGQISPSHWFESGSAESPAGPLAQLVEHLAVNRKVDGSNPPGTAFLPEKDF